MSDTKTTERGPLDDESPEPAAGDEVIISKRFFLIHSSAPARVDAEKILEWHTKSE